jgi:hypothetical protein
MEQNNMTRPLAELIDLDLPAAELERLARVDALLRAAAAHDASAGIASENTENHCSLLQLCEPVAVLLAADLSAREALGEDPPR